MPHCFLGRCIVVVEARGALVEQFPPLIVVGLLPANTINSINLLSQQVALL